MSAVVSHAWLMANSAEGSLRSPVSLRLQISFSARAPAALERFEIGDVAFVEVGDEHLEAVTVDVCEGHLRAGVWFFAADDGAGALGQQRTGRLALLIQ